MTKSTPQRAAAAMLLAALASALPGCLAYEVRNELRQANASLEDIKIKLDGVNSGLQKLERTNTVLADLDMKLTALETTNASLSSIDAHLASLRKTLNSIDSTIPFLKVSGDEEDALVETAEEKATREAGQTPAKESPAQQQPQEPAPSEPEPAQADPR
ncbi:MAG: hypothetical protein RIE32_06785 [Phycisphaerales bacterium]